MLYTNNYNLPEALVNAIGTPRKPVPNRYSVTDISNPPLIRHLKEKHWDNLTQDVSEMIWMLFGSAMHYIMEKGAPKDGLAEEKLEVSYKGKTLVGITDLWHNRVISDYKTTSVYAFLLGAKPEWTLQLNLYRWLYFVALGMETNKLEIHAILRDWQQGKTFDIEYPQIPFIVQDIPIVDPIQSLDTWLNNIDNPHPCTAEERWERATTYACVKKGNKSASRVLQSMEEADQWVAKQKNGVFEVQVRQGESARCKGYCICSKFCEYNPYRCEEAA